jgi:ERF superfamily protein
MANETTTQERLRQLEVEESNSDQMLMPVDEQQEQPRSVGRQTTTLAKNSNAFAFMETSDELSDLLLSLVEATKEFEGVEFDRMGKVAPKDASKQGYTYQYASLNVVMKAVRVPLANHGLILMHAARTVSAGNRTGLIVRTTLWHKSGQWIRTDLPVAIFGADPQAVGGGFSYAKRYNALGLLNLAPGDEDDDGEANRAAAEKEQQRQQSMPQPAARQSAQPKPQAAEPKPARDSGGNPVKQPEETRRAPEPEPTAPATAATTTTTDEPNCGIIKDVVDKPGGAFVVLLSTGFQAGSRSKELREQALKLKNVKVRIEFDEPNDPKFAKKLTGIKTF